MAPHIDDSEDSPQRPTFEEASTAETKSRTNRDLAAHPELGLFVDQRDIKASRRPTS
jgi:hypothetical protein